MQDTADGSSILSSDPEIADWRAVSRLIHWTLELEAIVETASPKVAYTDSIPT